MIAKLIRNLKRSDKVVVPTDKTNKWSVTTVDDYSTQMLAHLATDAEEVEASVLVEAHKEGMAFITDDLFGEISEKEDKYLTQKLDTRRVATPKLFIKDHKEPLANGSYPTRLVIPADGYMAGFGKMAFTALRRMFDDHNVVYTDRQIEQAYSLKCDMEERGYTRDNVTIASIDVEKMYPSMRFSILSAAVKYFARNLSRKDKETAKLCLRMLRFGMDHTYLQFAGKYYRYTGAGTADDPGLTIGGFESAWLADLGMSYILKKIPGMFRNTDMFKIYRDDGIVVFNGKVNREYVHNWVGDLQRRAHRVTKSPVGESLVRFTAVLWGDDDGGFDSNVVEMDPRLAFPFLDMEMRWAETNELHFQVHLKKDQRLQYLNKGSNHRYSTFEAIPRGVFIRLARLTTITDANRDMPIDERYPLHAAALRQAGLAAAGGFPTLGEARLLDSEYRQDAAIAADLEDSDEDSICSKPDRQSYQPGRDTFVKFGFSRFWSVPLHAKLKELRVKYGLKWLRIRMAYHCFPNLQSIFSADLGRKVMRGVSSEDCADADCNCQARFHIRDGQCIYGGKCNQHCTVYKATCRHCDKIYIGQTQTGLKKRFDGHFQVTRKQASGRDVASTTLSSHLTDHLHISHHPRRIGFHVDQIRPLIHVDIEWKGDTIAAMKSFRTRSCILCMKERWFIFKHRNSNIHSVLNQNLEVHKGCKHQTRFHRFVQDTGNPDP